MALIPMKQTITQHRASADLDEWGNPIAAPPILHKCRIDEGSYTTTGQGGSDAGKIVVATAKILLDKLVAIGYDDYIEYTNELGITTKIKPKRINVKRDIGGKPILTEVLL